ncbi:ABC transporter ATP-binding protein [Psychromonas hadalis]|uniref:ABC transporter ATP-binding protein n=1 Tax=Psychromonas hadalis TaxID=211669 RepID=UPI0003B3A019|nr:ABC transporter ATP-binding protein [Psychromonas hadalis]
MKNIDWAWLIQQVKQHKKRLLLANIIALIATLVSVPIPLLMPLMVDEVLLNKPDMGIDFMNQWLPVSWQQPAYYIVTIFICVILMRIISLLLGVWQSRQFILISKNITCQMRHILLQKLGRISISQYELRGSGGISSHIITDVETIDKFIGSTVSRFLISLLTVLGTAIILLWIDWRLGLFILLVNPMVVAFSRLLGSRVQRLKKRENQAFENFQNRLIETLDLIYQLRACHREKTFIDKLKMDSDAIKESADKYAWQSEAVNRFSFLLFLLGFELFRAVAMLLVLFSDLSIGQMFAVFGYLWFMLSPVQELLSIQFSWYSASAAIKRINTLLQLEEEKKLPSKVDPFINNSAISVQIKNVSFGYNEQREVLKNLSLTLPAGKKVALVGASGGGKSTLIQLLLGLYPINSGEILFNGQRCEDIGFDLIRTNIAVVLQQPILFNGSLRENLSLGIDYTDKQLWNALQVAQLGDLKAQLNAGLETQLGRSGVRLSGGQRQRVAIARMVLSDPKLVILDEATSALDTRTERKLHLALQTFLVGRTTLIVAHRLSAVKQADIIYVLEDGRLAQSGNHSELVKQEGLYQTLYGG